MPNCRVGQDGSKGFEVKKFLMRQPEVEEFDWDQQVEFLRPAARVLQLMRFCCDCPAATILLFLAASFCSTAERLGFGMWCMWCLWCMCCLW